MNGVAPASRYCACDADRNPQHGEDGKERVPEKMLRCDAVAVKERNRLEELQRGDGSPDRPREEKPGARCQRGEGQPTGERSDERTSGLDQTQADVEQSQGPLFDGAAPEGSEMPASDRTPPCHPASPLPHG